MIIGICLTCFIAGMALMYFIDNGVDWLFDVDIYVVPEEEE